ncbi:MAG TPA: adenylate/guanylate cyclase domain-containing protein [Longimicrobium sp.]|nr:adenylate/guanylate cyclase domain-containing protein [Longimicrobium sp.]
MRFPRVRSRRARRLLRGGAVGLVVAAVSLALRPTWLMQKAELATYDARAQAFADPAAVHPDIVIAAIDERSLVEMAPTQGRWPWSREVHASVLDYLAFAGAKAVIYDVQFAELDEHPGADARLAESLATTGLGVLPIGQAAGEFEYDNVFGERRGDVDVRRFALPVRGAHRVAELGRIYPPLPLLAQNAVAVGSVALNNDSLESTVRADRLVQRHGGRAYPSLAFAAARLVDPARWGGAVTVDGARLRTANGGEVPLHRGQMLIRWRGAFGDGATRQAYPVYTYSRLVQAYQAEAEGGRPVISPDEFRGKIVLVAATASSTDDIRSTPMGGKEPGVMIHATALDNLLRGDFMARAPGWVNAGTAALTALAAASVVALVGSAAWATAGVLLVLLLAAGAACAAFSGGVWLDAAAPAFGGVLAYAGAMAANYVTEGRDRRRVREMFSRYLDPTVVRQLADGDAELSLGGKRVPLTVLFSDIRGFTALSEKLPAETVVEMLCEYLGAMTEIVFRHGGTLDKFIGDAVMAFWNAPLSAPDHARRAVECALEMTAELERLNERWTQSGRQSDLRIGIGINTGEAVVGNIGSLKHKLDYTVIGDTVNLASRLEGLNKDMGTTIIISDATRAGLGDGYELAPLPEAHVKGKEQAVTVHELRGRRPATVPVSRAPAGAVVAGALLLALAAQPALAQGKQRWTDRVYQPGRWQAGQLAPWATTNPQSDTMALVAQVEGFARAPGWRAEIRRVGADQRLSEPLVLVGERNRVVVVTGVGSTPLERHAAKDDALVKAVVAQFDAAGAVRQPGAGRIVQRGTDRTVARVLVRRPAVNAEFDNNLLAMSRGRRTMNNLVQQATGTVASNRSEGSAASAAARGVTEVKTPKGTIRVTPNTAAVQAMDQRVVDAVAVDAFIREGQLEQSAPVKEEEVTQ